jgi:hypothetical protein
MAIALQNRVDVYFSHTTPSDPAHTQLNTAQEALNIAHQLSKERLNRMRSNPQA